jgi:PAS domain S-box-containing protein
MLTSTTSSAGLLLSLTQAISTSRSVEDIYAAALDALGAALGVARSSILLFDADGVMRFKAYRGLSDAYRQAVEGHTPWQPDSVDPQPIVVPDVAADPSLRSYMPVFATEDIAALAFIPLTSLDRVIGKFMLYYSVPTAPAVEHLELARVIAAQVAFAIERTRALAQARRSEERLRFALDAASMGTWDWDLTTNVVQWSDNLPVLHGLPPGTFDGTFASYEREIHPDDRESVLESARRAVADGVPHDVEYRVVAADGTVRWCEGKGRVEHRDGRPVQMSGVCMIVTRRKEAELARLAAAEEASRQKDEFLATLSHELRTPLNAILGWAQMLETRQLAPEAARQAVDVIGRNARLQAQLIEDILDVSRIISGKLEIEPGPVSVPQLLQTVVAGASPAAVAKQIAIRCDIALEVPPIEGDSKRLHQVLSNLLANAVKFTPGGGTIDVTCRMTGECVEVVVRDSGIGIPRDFLPFVFERFRQADSRASRKHGGLGLGLAIARHLVERHGGEIRADSAGPGTGTAMSIRLPAAASPIDAPRHWPSAVDDIRLDGVSVLVIDDEPDSREMLAALLQRRGARVAQGADAESALSLLRERPFDVLVADIAMPDVDGYELIRRVRAMGSAVPAVAVTAFARPDDRQRAIASGYSQYCAKPIDGLQVARTLRDVLRRR